MADRYATLVKQDDGTEIVSNIAQMEGVPPEIRDDAKDKYRVIKVADGVKIGMIKGGPVDKVGGFGWPEGSPSEADAPKKEPPASSNPEAKSRAEVSGTKKA